MIGLYILAGLSGIVLILLIWLNIVLSRQKAAEKRAIDANARADEERAQIDANTRESVAVTTLRVVQADRAKAAQEVADAGQKISLDNDNF